MQIINLCDLIIDYHKGPKSTLMLFISNSTIFENKQLGSETTFRSRQLHILTAE